jgi:hypothetical protein
MSHINPFLLQMVDEILFYEWDPIGINDHLEARDEYGAYVGKICSSSRMDARKNGWPIISVLWQREAWGFPTLTRSETFPSLAAF